MPVKAPVYKAPVVDWWDGFYVGVNLGYSAAKWDTLSSQHVFDFESSTASPRLNGIVGGAQLGLNVQVGRHWVLGFEADLQSTKEKAAQTWTDPGLPAIVPPPPPPPPPPTPPPPEEEPVEDFVPRAGGPAQLSHTWSFPWFATARLRAGVTLTDWWLFYVTGGAVFGETRYSFTFSQPGAAANVPPTPTSFALATRSYRAGYTFGAGTEIKLDRNWSVKLEYLFLDLGKISIDTLDIDGAPFHVEYRARDHILRIGLNWQFGSPRL
jgi:outer membrane immunogenic protein